MLRIILLGAAVLGMTFTMGCSSLGKWQSVDAGKIKDKPRAGVAYWLPTSAFHVALEVKEADDEIEVSLAVTSEIVPDTSAKDGLQYLAHVSNPLFSDKMKIVVNERGLLESVSADVEDQTGKSLVAIVEIAANVMKLAAGIPTPADDTPKDFAPEAVAHDDKETCGSLDDQLRKLSGTREWMPATIGQETAQALLFGREAAKAKVQRATAAAAKTAAKAEVEAQAKAAAAQKEAEANPGKVTEETAAQAKKDATKAADAAVKAKAEAKAAEFVTDVCTAKIVFSANRLGDPFECANRRFCSPKQHGVKYRVPVPYAVKASLVVPYGSYSISSSDADKPVTLKEWTHETAAVAMVPSDDTLTLPFRRVDFVKSVQNATLTNGMLTSLEIDRPSPFLGFLQIPLEVTERILKIPSELLTFKIESLGSQKDLIEAQAGVIEATKALEALSEADASSGKDTSQ